MEEHQRGNAGELRLNIMCALHPSHFNRHDTSLKNHFLQEGIQ